jgi:hypothetical protein
VLPVRQRLLIAWIESSVSISKSGESIGKVFAKTRLNDR